MAPPRQGTGGGAGRRFREPLPVGSCEWPRACVGRATGDCARRCIALGAGAMIAAVQTIEGILLVDMDEEQILGDGNELPEVDAPGVELPRVVATARAGSTIAAIVERRPPV